ncbi:MAG: hypothetical protein OEU92_20625, partial [Alphaproteobacteria bacterium]|nr:hypothetical protein [Alphaproteobacteria bacterium]
MSNWALADVTVEPTRDIPDGKLDYTPVADVSPQSGDYTPRIPLGVLPGAAGQRPTIELVYSKSRKNGVLGAGWGLSTNSSVQRRSKLGGLAEMTDDDSFWIDGQRLIELADGSYRTEQDDFTLYSKVENEGRIIGWTALKDGFTRHYGSRGTLPSLVADANAVKYQDEEMRSGVPVGSAQVEWLLSATTTAFGVEVAYRYVIPDVGPIDQSSRRHLLDKIVYADTDTSTIKIDFGYIGRKDVRTSFASGPKRFEAHLLRRIVVKRIAEREATSHYYLLDYKDAVHSPQSMLAEVRRLTINNPLSPPTLATEASAPAESIARFSYEDSETTWSEQQPILLIGKPELDEIEPLQQYFTLSQNADVNGDSRPDLIIFNDICTPDKEDIPQPPGDLDVPSSIVVFLCEPHHQVFINSIQEIGRTPNDAILRASNPSQSIPVSALRENALVYDSELSDQVKTFFESLHEDLSLKVKEISIADLDKDGYADLIKPGSFILGSAAGWRGTATSATWTHHLDDHGLADINGDGFVDLVAQSHYYANSGRSPYFDLASEIAIEDPVVDGDASPDFNTTDASCLDAGDTNIHLRSIFGVNGLGLLSAEPNPQNAITADEWVWQNTRDTDVNGDGLLDRIISFPFLQFETQVASPDARQLWVRNDGACGTFDEVFLGDGIGRFHPTNYGIGGPQQKQQTVSQTRILDQGLDDPERDEFVFNYHLNHFAAGDLDGDGRNEIIQACAGEAAHSTLWHQGVAAWRGYGPGYQTEAENGVCPNRFIGRSPEQFFGQSLLDYHTSTLVDFDGDGQEDLLQYAHPHGPPEVLISNQGTPWEGWADGLHWRKSQRTTSQNRLKSITWPHGGSTEVTWAWSAEHPDNQFAINVEHVESLKSASGKSTMAFTEGRYDDGEFLGFGRVETLRPGSSMLVQTFFNTRVLRNKRSTEELYDQGGRLKNLRVHIPGSDQPTIVLDSLELDNILPYYNPLQRLCEYEFGSFNGGVPLGGDIDGLIARCEAFEDEEGLTATGVFDSRSVFAVFRGEDPSTFAVDSSERRELTALHDILMGREQSSVCNDARRTSGNPSALAICNHVERPTVRGDSRRLASNDTLSKARSWSPAPKTTKWMLATPASGLPNWAQTQIELETERMFITEYDYDDNIGHIVEKRELRDVETTDDSLIHRFEYSSWNDDLGGVKLRDQTTSNRRGRTFEEIEYRNFENGQWRTRIQHSTVGNETRRDRRSFGSLGELLSDTDPLGHTTTYAYGGCGTPVRVTNPLGHAEATVLDDICRIERTESEIGSETIKRTDLDYDGHGRVVRQQVHPTPGASDPMPKIVQSFVHNSQSGPLQPASVSIEPEPDGSTTLFKTFVDEWGRTIKSQRCMQRDQSGDVFDLPGLSICSIGTIVNTDTVYDDETGYIVEVTGPYRLSDASKPTHRFVYDEFGRKVVEQLPDETSLNYAYRLGHRFVTDQIGRRTTVTFDTLNEEIRVNGQFRGATKRDAFGRV